MSNTYLQRTPSSTTNRKTFTISTWVKRSGITGLTQKIFEGGVDGNTLTDVLFRTDESLRFYSEDAGITKINFVTNRLFRDTSAWYHIVVAVDTTQGTEANRVKIYVNGVQETSFATATYPALNYNTFVNYSSAANVIGRRSYYGDLYFNGSMSHINFVDGTAELPTAFGEYDANGVWTIKTSPSVTYGTNGFFILKDGNSVTDQSPNTNDFTVGGGTLTNTLDCPDNVFATGNPLHKGTNLGDATFSNGNLTHNGTSSGGSYPYTFSTLAASSGKWYAEFKKIAGDTMIGIGSGISDSFLGGTGSAYGYAMYPTGEVFTSGSGNAYGNALSNNDIIGVAMDLDNSKCYWSKNGVWQNSGDPTSGATGTGAFSIQSTTSNTTGFYHFAYGKAGNDVTDIEANFGNGYFGTTAVTDAGINASGIGIFEYDVPTGFTALSTKGLNL